MEIKTASTRMQSLITLFDMHTDFFSKAIDGISDENAQNRLNTKANHVAWITGSLVQERFELAKIFGINETQSADELFKNHKGIQDGVKYPPLSEFKKDWDKISPKLREKLISVSDKRLDEIFEMPGEDFKMTYYELFSFMTYREANCIGQIALWRRLLGLEAMKYM